MLRVLQGGSVVEGTFDHAEGVDPDGSFFEVEEEQGPGEGSHLDGQRQPIAVQSVLVWWLDCYVVRVCYHLGC